MTQMITFFGIPAVVLLSFVVAIGVEVLVLGSAIRLMGRAVARTQESHAANRHNSVR